MYLPIVWAWGLLQYAVSAYKATPNKFSVSRLGFKHICMQAGGPFPLFHYKIGSFSNHYFPGTTIKSCIKACLSLFLPF